jgi:hypothetical protein
MHCLGIDAFHDYCDTWGRVGGIAIAALDYRGSHRIVEANYPGIEVFRDCGTGGWSGCLSWSAAPKQTSTVERLKTKEPSGGCSSNGGDLGR